MNKCVNPNCCREARHGSKYCCLVCMWKHLFGSKEFKGHAAVCDDKTVDDLLKSVNIRSDEDGSTKE